MVQFTVQLNNINENSMTKGMFTNSAVDETIIRLSDFQYKYDAISNIWLLNRLAKTVNISVFADVIINNITNKLGPTTASSLGMFAGDTLFIPENFWVWSDYTGAPAIIMDVENTTLDNHGVIIGRGGNGGASGGSGGAAGSNGGPAIAVTAELVKIKNNTTGFIAGGGGGGGGSAYSSGGGGAGGGTGGGPTGDDGFGSFYGGSAGPLNSIGSNGNGRPGYWGYGGGTGGGGGHTMDAGAKSENPSGSGGGGGRILSGTGGSGANGGNGGSLNTTGDTAYGTWPSGGGGGWGASGGGGGINSGASGAGGIGGNGIIWNGNISDVVNNGTIYGGYT